MREALRRDDAFRSALERLPVAVIVIDGQRRLQPFNARATEFFAREGLHGDLVASRPSHPLSIVVLEVLTRQSMETRTVLFPSGARYRVECSQQSPKGVGRWLILLISSADEELAAPQLEAFNFTPREKDVARLLLEGKTTNEISAALKIRGGTFKTHLRRLFEKTEARTRAEFVAKVFRRSR